MHASIERVLKKTVICVPSDYIVVIPKAQPVSQFGQYSVEYLTHEYFCDFSDLEKYSSICPGCRTGDPNVNDLVGLQYANGKISYKINFKDDCTPLPDNHIKKGNSILFIHF